MYNNNKRLTRSRPEARPPPDVVEGGGGKPSGPHNRPYEEFTRLAETRLARNSLLFY